MMRLCRRKDILFRWLLFVPPQCWAFHCRPCCISFQHTFTHLYDPLMVGFRFSETIVHDIVLVVVVVVVGGIVGVRLYICIWSLARWLCALHNTLFNGFLFARSIEPRDAFCGCCCCRCTTAFVYFLCYLTEQFTCLNGLVIKRFDAVRCGSMMHATPTIR